MGLVTVADILRNQAIRRPDHPAFIYISHARTWRECNTRVDGLAAGLWALGVRPGDVICTLCKDGPILVEVLFAAARIGAVRVGLNYRFSSAEIATLVRHSGAKLIIAQHDLRHLVDGLELEFGIIDGGDGQGDLGDFERVYRFDLAPPAVEVTDQTLAQICYTTGSTGTPKGAMWTHAAYIHVVGMASLDLTLTPDDIFLHCLPAAGVPCVLATWNVGLGFTNVIMPAFDPDLALDLIERHKVSFTLWVPTMIAAACDAAGRKPRDVSSMRTILYGSAPTPPALVRRAFKVFNGAELVQVYGSTEGIGGWFTKLPAADHRRALAGNEKLLESCGQPMLHARVEVVNEKDEVCPVGEVGEVRVSGGFLMSGYYQADDITQKTLKHGWLYTGDMGRLDDDGYLYLVDRKQFMIITGGYNVYPIEVENVIAEHPAVQEVCVFGVPHEKWGEAIHAAIVSRRGVTASEDEIMSWCRERLSSFKMPKSLEFRDGLIRGATGKILKRAERARYLETQ